MVPAKSGATASADAVAGILTGDSPAWGVHAAHRRASVSARTRIRSTDPVIHPKNLEDGTPVRAESNPRPAASAPSAVTPPDLSAIARLRALLDVTRLVRDETDTATILDAIAGSIATSLGFRTVVVNTYRPAWNDFEVTTVHGSDEARRTLLGDTLPWEAWEPLLDERFAVNGAYMIPHGAFDWDGRRRHAGTSPTGSRARTRTRGTPTTSSSCRCATPTVICSGSSRWASRVRETGRRRTTWRASSPSPTMPRSRCRAPRRPRRPPFTGPRCGSSCRCRRA